MATSLHLDRNRSSSFVFFGFLRFNDFVRLSNPSHHVTIYFASPPPQPIFVSAFPAMGECRSKSRQWDSSFASSIVGFEWIRAIDRYELRRDDEGEELGRDLISLLVEATHSKRTCCVSIFKFYFFFLYFSSNIQGCQNI